MKADLVALLWSRAREALELMRMALGDPQAVMNLGWLSRRQKREILSWLAPLEVLARKLLMIHAARLGPLAPRKAAPPPPPKEQKSESARPLRARFVVLKRQRKRVKLRPLPRIDIFGAHAPAPPKPPPRRGRLAPGVRLALRYQALIDVLAKPGPAARRLARTLRANACLAFMLAAAPCPVASDYFDYDLRAAARHAEIAAKHFADTS